jgi:redox-sensitive bicupin YhaK (pirin superfamily)
MIAVRRAEERHRTRMPKRAAWASFRERDPEDPWRAGFGALEALHEQQFAGGARMALRSDHPVELISYVLVGAVEHEDADGRAALLQAGEFQCVTLGRGADHRQQNRSPTQPAQVFQVRLRISTSGFEPRQEQRRFSTAQRRGRLCVVAALGGGSWLQLSEDILVCSALLDPGQHVVHELRAGRAGWLHVVNGTVRLGTVILNEGDAAGLIAERAIPVTAQTHAEILLFDLHEPAPSAR